MCEAQALQDKKAMLVLSCPPGLHPPPGRSAGPPAPPLPTSTGTTHLAWAMPTHLPPMASQSTLDRLQAEFDSPPEAIAAAVNLLEDQASPAFIARYRRWATGNMSEERLCAIAERLHFLGDVEARKQAIAQQAAEKGGLAEELQQVLEHSVDQDLLDDIYQSMRPRRRTAAVQMEEKGLGALALAIRHRQLGDLTLQDAAKEYLSEEKGLPSIEPVLEGVALILGEQIATDPKVRARFREELTRGILKARAVNPDHSGAARYKDFFDFSEPIGRIGTSRMLALRRAERENLLQLTLTLPEGLHRELLRLRYSHDLPEGSQLRDFYDVVFDHAFQHHLQDACSKDVRRRMKEKADREAVRVYGRNLRSQLLAPPLGHKKVMSLRTSGRAVWVALLGEDGSVAQHHTLPLETDEQRQESLARLVDLVRVEQPHAIALPHGRRQAGSEKLVAELRAALGETPMPMTIPVDEAASAIFAASQSGRKALPGVDVGVRTAVSLGRRLQDPLRELMSMDFRTLGIGQTIDEVHQGMLRRELDAVVSSCVGTVGLDLNTADKDSLCQVPGITPELAQAILDHRRKHGGFKTRQALAEVPGIDERTLRHIAGFLRIEGGDEPLDATMLHPEDYDLARAIAAKKGGDVTALFGQELRDLDLDAFTGEGIDRLRVLNVVQTLRHAGTDPRGELAETRNEGVHSIADLRSNHPLKGRVANLTEFGAFIDLGIGQDGLVHISQIPNHRLHNPEQMLRVGEVVQVWLLHADQETRKISLTMHQPRHLAEGRQATIGERIEQQRGRRPDRRREREEPKPTMSRAARIPESRRGKQRSSPLTLEGKPESARGEGGGDGGERRPRFGGRDRRDDDRRGGGGGSRESRVFTVESGKEAAETKGRKGELTSLAGLRALLQRDPSQGNPTASPDQPS